MTAEVDVLIPVYNAVRTLRDAIRSIQQQVGVSLRIIIVNDGSTDGSSELLKEIAATDSRIIILEQKNSGIVSALNLALAQATSPIIARHDSDDLADPDRLAKQLRYLRLNDDCVAVSSFARHIAWNGSATSSIARFRPVEEASAYTYPAREPYLLHPFLLARRWALESVGGYRHVLNAEDSDLYWRLAERGRLHVMPEILGDYRLSPGGISSASIVAGRILALFSQLAAISARRRAAGRVDLEFSAGWSAELTRHETSASMLAAASTVLEPVEAAYLYPAFAAKLLELTSYRPYELDQADCILVRRHLASRTICLTNSNRRDLHRAHALAVGRLLFSGRWRSAFSLISLSRAPASIARYLSFLSRVRKPKPG